MGAHRDKYKRNSDTENVTVHPTAHVGVHVHTHTQAHALTHAPGKNALPLKDIEIY